MAILDKLKASHIESLRSVKIADLKIIGSNTIQALHRMDVFDVGGLLDLPEFSVYQAVLPRDIYENILALRRIVLLLAGRRYPNSKE